MEEKVMKIIEKEMKLPREELELDIDIFESNMISSLGLLELIAKLEKEFKITILPEELVHENFGTIGLMVQFLKTKIK